MHMARYILLPDVCLPVCLSVTSQYCVKNAEHVLKVLSYNRTIIYSQN